MMFNKLFYTLKPAIPRRLQIFLRRQIARYKRRKYSHIWPIDPASNKPPDGWTGWPDGKKFALLLCHDVDTQQGHDHCLKLAELEAQLGFRSYYNFVPERYHNSGSVFKELRKRGFEIGVHGLTHDGKLFRSRKIFDQRAVKITDYMSFEGEKSGSEAYPVEYYIEFLEYVKTTYAGDYYHAHPSEIARFWNASFH